MLLTSNIFSINVSFFVYLKVISLNMNNSFTYSKKKLRYKPKKTYFDKMSNFTLKSLI